MTQVPHLPHVFALPCLLLTVENQQNSPSIFNQCRFPELICEGLADRKNAVDVAGLRRIANTISPTIFNDYGQIYQHYVKLVSKLDAVGCTVTQCHRYVLFRLAFSTMSDNGCDDDLLVLFKYINRTIKKPGFSFTNMKDAEREILRLLDYNLSVIGHS